MDLEPRQRAYSQADESEHMLSLRDVVRIIWSRFWVVLLTVVTLVGIAVGFSLTQTPTYEAVVKVLVGQRQDVGDTSNLGSNVEGLQRLTKTLAEAAITRPVAEAATERLNLGIAPENLLENLEAQQIPETQFITVSYRDSNPERAQLIANTSAGAISELITEVSPDANAVTAQVWEPAAVPANPASPNLMLNALLALVVGAALGVGLAFLLEYLDDSWRSPEAVERISGVPNFGIIPSFAVPKEAVENKTKVGQ